jgi:hypothetical protein
LDWQLQLVTVYLTVCEAWQRGVGAAVQRFSPNRAPVLTDQEAVTLYLFGVLIGLKTIRQIYDYTDRHLRDWFPALREYKAFVYRLNKASPAFSALCESIIGAQENLNPSLCKNWVVDSFPIIIAGPRRSSKARVARDLADKGFCASKDLYFYGVQLHCVGLLGHHTLPQLAFAGLAPASVNDHVMFKQMSHELTAGRVFADKAYKDKDHAEELGMRNISLLTPLKKTKNLFTLPGAETFSSWVSQMRQPIESFFNWVIEKTNIQTAAKVRSSSGLLVHTFGKLAAAIILMTTLRAS